MLIVLTGNRSIKQIVDPKTGRDTGTWDVGYPLLENLSSGREKRHMVTFAELPTVLVDAVVSVEDKHFFHHRGLDLPRIAKAAYVDLREHRKEQGASTLTMQLVRGLWLQPQKRWKRKIAEAVMTVHLERKWPKEEIFTATPTWFFWDGRPPTASMDSPKGRTCSSARNRADLTLPEAALLAGMVQRPSYFNPFAIRNRQRAPRHGARPHAREQIHHAGSSTSQAVNCPS